MIRIANEADLEELKRIFPSILPESPVYNSLSYNHKKAINSLSSFDCVLVFVKEGKLMGFLLGYLGTQWFSDDVIGYESLVYVLPEYRGRSVYFGLMKQFVSWCKQAGCKQIYSGSSFDVETNMKVCILLSHLGFKQQGTSMYLQLGD